MKKKWPRRLVPHNSHYLVHKVHSAEIQDEILRFHFVHETGDTYNGPCYMARVNGEKPRAEKYFAADGIDDVSDIRYVIVYHCGAFPNGMPNKLLTDFPSPAADDYAERIS